jgi:hypothetical protein
MRNSICTYELHQTFLIQFGKKMTITAAPLPLRSPLQSKQFHVDLFRRDAGGAFYGDRSARLIREHANQIP